MQPSTSERWYGELGSALFLQTVFKTESKFRMWLQDSPKLRRLLAGESENAEMAALWRVPEMLRWLFVLWGVHCLTLICSKSIRAFVSFRLMLTSFTNRSYFFFNLRSCLIFYNSPVDQRVAALHPIVCKLPQPNKNNLRSVIFYD